MTSITWKFTVLYVLTFNVALGQKMATVDSIEYIINNSPNDTIAVRELWKWDFLVRNTNRELDKKLNLKILEICNANFEKQITPQEKLFYSKSIADASNGLGIISAQQGEYKLALEYYSVSRAMQNSLGNLKSFADVSFNMGLVHSATGNIQQALACFEIALKIQTELDLPKSIAMTSNAIGIIYRTLGDHEEALDYFMRSLTIRQKLNDRRGILRSYISLGVLFQEKGELCVAIDYYSKSLAISIESGDKDGAANTLGNLSVTYRALGEYDRALEVAFEGLTLKIELGDIKDIAGFNSNIGSIYADKKEHLLAIEFFNKSLEMSKTIGDTMYTALTLINLSLVYCEMGQFDSAKNAITESIDLFYTLDYKFGKSNAIGTLSHIELLQGNFEAAVIAGLEALNLASNPVSPQNQRSAAKCLFIACLRQDEPDRAMEYLSLLRLNLLRSVETNFFSLSETEKVNYFNTIEQDLGLYYDFTVANYSNNESLSDTSFNMILQTKGLTLKSSTAMRAAIQNSNDSLLIADYDSWVLLKKKIADMGAQGADTKQETEEANYLEKELIKKSDAFSDFDKIKNLDWKQIRDGLKENEAAVEFVNFKSEIDTANPVIYAAFVVRQFSKHPDVIRLCNESDLTEILGTFQGNNLGFVNSVYGTRDEAQTALYQKIWQPLEKHLEGVKTVYYSPSGLLHKISFATISKSKNVFLSDVYNFRQMGSTGKIALPEDIAFGELENFLLMGGVDYNSANSNKEVWSYLPGSLQETESINAFLLKKKFGVNYFHSNDASEEIFKEKIVSSSIVHIATHGFFFPDPDKLREEMKANSESNQELKFRGTTNYANWSFVNNKNPLMRSGIVLANANDVWERDTHAEGEDGILTAQEVSNLDLRNTKLVVLSACETGLGDINGSEGVFGLQRAFKMAGVNYLIMSLWQVPDKETSEFMILFYKNLIKLKDIPTAFQKTQKVMREKYDPYYWGAFVLIE